MSLTGSLFNSGLFKGGIFSGGLFNKPSTEFPGSLFAGGYVGAWLDINDLTLLYTTDSGSTHVAAVSDAIGRAETKNGGTVNALQATASLRPILGQWPSGGRYYAYHDRVDDKLTLAGMPAGTYTIGTASFSGVQIYEASYSAGTLSIPGVDFTELFLINRTITTTEKNNLIDYLSTKTPVIGTDEVLRIYCYDSSVNLSIAESASSGATWLLGDGQTATGLSCVKTITPPQSVILSATDKTNIKSVLFSIKNLYGQPDISKLPNLLNAYLALNQFSGNIDLSSNTILENAYLYGNNFSGFSGSVPPTLGNLVAQNNKLTSISINNVLAALVAAGRTSASGTCVVNLSGTNMAAPTGQGIIDKATLISRGWTVTTN